MSGTTILRILMTVACILTMSLLVIFDVDGTFDDYIEDENFLLYCAALVISVLPIILSIDYLREQIKHTKKHFDSIERPNIILAELKPDHSRIKLPNSSSNSLDVGILIKNVGKNAAFIIKIELCSGYLYRSKGGESISDVLGDTCYHTENFGKVDELASDESCFLQWRIREEELEEMVTGNRYCFKLLVWYTGLEKRYTDTYKGLEKRYTDTDKDPFRYNFVGYINRKTVITSNNIAAEDNTIIFDRKNP